MTSREAYLHDCLVASFLGVAFGLALAVPTAASIEAANWGQAIGALVLAGIFGFIPGGLIAGYVNFRFHRMEENTEMAGLSAGFFAALVFAIIDLIIALEQAITATSVAGNIFIGWVLSAIFGFIFFTIGGYLSGMFEKRPFAMPTVFNLSQIQRRAPAPPPPPPGAATTCPSCGGPLRYIQQYQRWYCDKEQKYV
jgi:phosphate/sulfate permease